MRTGSVWVWGALGAWAAVAVACGSSRSGGEATGGAGSGGTGAAATAGHGGVAGSTNNGGSFGHAGTLAMGGTSGGSAGKPAGDAGQGGQNEAGEGGVGGEGGTPDPGPQAPVAFITVRQQPNDYDTNPHAVMQPDLAESRGLWLQSSHLVVDGTSYDWYGEVKNFGSEVVCTPLVNIKFFSDLGQGLERYNLAASVRPKLMLTSLTKGSIRCLGPGESAVALAHAVVQLSTKVEDTMLEVVSWQSESTMDLEADPKAPTLEQLTAVGNDVGGYFVHGFVDVGTAQLSSLSVYAYPRVRGVIGGSVAFSIIGQELPAQSQHEFATSRFSQQFTTFLTAVEYFEP